MSEVLMVMLKGLERCLRPFGFALRGNIDRAHTGLVFEFLLTPHDPGSFWHLTQMKIRYLVTEEEIVARAGLPPTIRDWTTKKVEWIARSVLDQALEKIMNPPQAGEIDWRPMETVPEDFYAF